MNDVHQTNYKLKNEKIKLIKSDNNKYKSEIDVYKNKLIENETIK